tara:strand:- start:2153 stop:2959 length:807 start_codon:yes stop_codon:yes gene_type:complete
MAYATGKFAKALCDRCGFEYKLLELKEEWNGLKVCNSCYEPKHPQLEPLRAKADPEALYRPRPNNDNEAGEGFVVVLYTNIERGNSMDPNIIGSNFTISGMTGSVGSTQILTSGEAPAPDPTPTAELTGFSATASLGSVTVSVASITLYTVTVVGGNPSNHPYYNFGSTNKFAIDGSTATADVTLTLAEGRTYQFGQADSSNTGHPLRFSTTANGTHSGGSEYTTGVTIYGTPGSGGAYTEITVASGAPTLYYYCTNHSGMGWTANTV